MGISGHILSDRRVATLSRRVGLDLARAYHRNGRCEGVVHAVDGCHHYRIDYYAGTVIEEIAEDDLEHWTSCPERRG